MRPSPDNVIATKNCCVCSVSSTLYDFAKLIQEMAILPLSRLVDPGPAIRVQKGGRMIVLQIKKSPLSLIFTYEKKTPFFSKTLT